MRFLSMCLYIAFSSTAMTQKPAIRIGICADGDPNDFQSEYLPVLQREVRVLLERDYDVQFPERFLLRGNWDRHQIERNLNQLVGHDEVDIVICFGIFSSLQAAQSGPYLKPVFAPFGIDPDLPIYPRKGDSSGVHNLNYLVTANGMDRDLPYLKKLKDVDRVHLIGDELFLELIPNLNAYLTSRFSSHDLKLKIVAAADRAQPILDQLDEHAEFVYITPLLRLPNAERDLLIEGLKRKKLPSFSLLGREHVERGVLAGAAPKTDFQRTMRRMALNILSAIGGEDPGDMSVTIRDSQKLTINMETARAIGWYPIWDIYIEADLLHERQTEAQMTLSLGDAVERAVAANLELAATNLDRDIHDQQRRQLSSQRLPQTKLSVLGAHQDTDTAVASFGLQPKRLWQASLTAEQLIYSDSINAAIDAQNQVHLAINAGIQSTRLDIALESAIRFLNLLKAKAAYHIQSDNLDLTQSHLDTALLRRDIGIANPSEVLRWQSQVATDKQRAIRARTQVDSARYALNQILHLPQEQLVEVHEPDLADPRLLTGLGRLLPYVNNEESFGIFRDFMVDEGLRRSPEAQQLEALIQAKRRELRASERAQFVPTVGLQAKYNLQLDREAGGSVPPIPELMMQETSDHSWSVALNFSLPLTSGGRLKAEREENRYLVTQLERRYDSVCELVELGIRVALQDVGAATPAMRLSQDAANAAHKNLELVNDAYAKGLASTLDVLDAQNATLTADQAAANATYDFLIQLMKFQRAAGNIDFFVSAAERTAFFERLDRHYQTKNDEKR